MGAIHENSAAAAGFLLISIIFAIASVNTISSHVAKAAIDNIPYGSVLLLASLGTLCTGMTSPSPNRTFVLPIILCLAVLWSSVGLHHIWKEVNYSQNASSSYYVSTHETLFSGYGGFLLVFLVFLGSSLINRNFRSVAVLILICLVLFTFEIVNLFSKVQGKEVLLIIASLISFYISASYIADNYKRTNSILPDQKKTILPKKNQNSKLRDHILVLYALNVVCFSVFASHATNITSDTRFSFPWVVSTGVFQLVTGVSSLRRSDSQSASHVIIFGLFWLSIGSSLMLETFLWKEMSFLIPTSVVLVLLFLVLFCVEIKMELFRSVYFLMTSIFALSLGVDGFQGTFISVMGWIGLLTSLYGLIATNLYILDFEYKLPLGEYIFNQKRIHDIVTVIKEKISIRKPVNHSISREFNQFSANIMLGFSKYVDSQRVGFAVNAVAAFSLIWIPSESDPLILPWTVGFGGLIQFVVGFVSFSRGMTFESCSFLLYGSFWSIWGTVRALSLIEGAEGAPLVIGLISFLATGLLFLALSTTVNKIWVMNSSIFCLMILAFILHGLAVSDFGVYEIVVAIAYVLIFMYSFIAVTIRNVWGRDVLPMGKPIFQVSKIHSGGSKALFMDPRRATGVKTTAEILNNGGICGIPTDTVYVLVAACNKPDAVERAYNTKKMAEDRPMSLWISNINQITEARSELGELCWSFMQKVWPSNISLVLNKGDWVNSLGLQNAERLIGKPDSIAVRIPDSTHMCHLIDQTGPIAVTSANPTGEADTTHHLQVLAKLGIKNCDGILADGPSQENAASTVVDCRKISEGKIGFFRIGLTPKSRVEEIFSAVRLMAKDDTVNGSCSNGSHNAAFEADDDIRASFKTNGPNLLQMANMIGGKHDQNTKTNPVFEENK